MVYRQDNRPKRHRGRYTILGIALGICITIGGIYVYENYKGQIKQNVSQIEDKTIQVVQKTYPAIKVDTNTVNQNDQVNTNVETQPKQQQPTKIDTLTLEKEIHSQINKIRKDNGLNSLIYDEKLSAISRLHSQDMAINDYFDHVSLDGRTLQDRYRNANYVCFNWSGENIEKNFVSNDNLLDSIISTWMESQEHKDNILYPKFVNEGIGVYINENTVLVTEDFC